jgi:hypothetical protein
MQEMAFLSAQIDMPYEAFSTLQPRMTLPSDIKSALPTLNLEYGAYARSAALCALFKSASGIISGQGHRKLFFPVTWRLSPFNCHSGIIILPTAEKRCKNDGYGCYDRVLSEEEKLFRDFLHELINTDGHLEVL